MRKEEKMRRFVEHMWQWYSHHKRTLPWRDLEISDDTQRAYMILVSEVMLQQTQVSRVKITFKQFIERFPTMQDLAKASNRDVLIAWRGMGYNSRALRLRDAARVIGEREFPRSMEELKAIPGIGPYTAAAMRNFAFSISTPCVDTNIERILGRVFGVRVKKRVEEKAEEVLKIALEPPPPNPLPRLRERGKHPTAVAICPSPPQGGGERGGGKTAHWHAALMDFGSAVCTKRSPKCAKCPLSKGICKSAFRVSPLRQAQGDTRKEPGRLVGSTFIPNRIFRGKVVELLRDHPKGLVLRKIGQEVCIDWEWGKLRRWMTGILRNLERDGCIARRGMHYMLSNEL